MATAISPNFKARLIFTIFLLLILPLCIPASDDENDEPNCKQICEICKSKAQATAAKKQSDSERSLCTFSLRGCDCDQSNLTVIWWFLGGCALWICPRCLLACCLVWSSEGCCCCKNRPRGQPNARGHRRRFRFRANREEQFPEIIPEPRRVEPIRARDPTIPPNALQPDANSNPDVNSNPPPPTYSSLLPVSAPLLSMAAIHTHISRSANPILGVAVAAHAHALETDNLESNESDDKPPGTPPPGYEDAMDFHQKSKDNN